MTANIFVGTDRLDAFLSAVQAMAGKKVFVGIPEDEANRKEADYSNNAALGHLHEYGSTVRNIPARPFLVTGVSASNGKIASVLKASAKNLLKKGSLENGLNAAGLIAQSSVKRTITQGVGFAPLSDATLAARKARGFKGTKPLIRTGQLLNSIKYVVRASNGAA